MKATRGACGEWVYPPVVAAIKSVVFHPIGEYIRIWQATISEKVDCRPIYEICAEAERMPGQAVW